jgi:DNA-binding XRE family transcriptional regulator
MVLDPVETAIQIAGQVVLGPEPGRIIREARKRYGFTQDWLAAHLEVRRESLSRIESGHSTPTLDVVARFARTMALAQTVRAHAALLERRGVSPSPRDFRPQGTELGLAPEVAEDVARVSLASYTAKRDTLLEGLRTPGGWP